MTKKEFFDLLNKFEQGKCSEKEESLLFDFYSKFQNREGIRNFNLSKKEEARIRLLERINNSIEVIHKKEFQRKKWKGFARITAIFIGLIVVGYLYKGITSANTKEIPQDAITLELEDGTIEILEADGETRVLDSEGNIAGRQKRNKIIYGDIGAKELSYNTLTVPYGKKFDLILSDGTSINLNAGTSIKYPVTFIEGRKREIFVDGEAFLKVAKDTLHPFVVNANDLDVTVLGTQFNVANYPEDNHMDIVLVEGSVRLEKERENEKEENSIVLSPGFKGTYLKDVQKISKEKVNTQIYTSWVKGSFVFKNAPFKNIAKKLERRYNVLIVNNNPSFDNQLFNGTIEVGEETIKDVMEHFKILYKIDYVIQEEKVIINP